ncbi:MAG: CaiB/BaiF CoA-transferase family protein [Gemmatimonadota bacterium]|nr:CaiB/BaiF CoA-transferase family protein [Gemmatimonadota bacterium]MDE2983946.1 CaiB/BaiF CoA-transferase family protein [Gemmatimonadota bacterium]
MNGSGIANERAAGECGGRGALAGIRVLELAHIMAGPVCGRMLADMGADVVKVEAPGGGDPTRALVPLEGVDTSGAFVMMNRGKRGIVVDLKGEEGRGVVRRLLARCDVVIENFRKGVMEGFGLGYESLRAANPGLVYCQITGFGRTGPLAEHGGFDLIAQGMTGLMSVTGEGPGRPPVKCGPPLTDITAGILGAMGVLAALYSRERKGVGQRVDTSLYEAGLVQTFWQSAVALATGESPGPLGSAHPLAAPYEALPTADGWITIGGWNQVNWLRLLDALDLGDLADDPRFATNDARMKNQAALREVLARRLRTATSEEWLQRLERASVPAGPVLSMLEALRHPQTVAREMVVTVGQGGEAVETLGMPVKLSEAPGAMGRGAPRPGEHTEEVLGEYGFDEGEIAQLLRLGAVGRFKA